MISVCLIVKNEEKWIEGCLRSIESIADEIIVVDTGSTDSTVQKSKAFSKVKFFQIPWANDFGGARNFAIENATHDWILSFDADEKFSALEAKKLRALIERLHPQREFEAIRLVRRDFVRNPSVSGFEPCRGEHADVEENQLGYYTEKMIRVFRRAYHIRWIGKLHEMVDETLKGKTFESDLIFHHYGYLPEESARKDKRSFYQEQGAKKIQENPNDWKARYDLAIECLEARNFEKSLSLFSEAAKLLPKEHPQKAVILSNWGYALMELGKLDQAEQLLVECVKVDPKSHDGYLNLAVTQMRKKLYAKAIEVLNKLIEIYPQSFSALRNRGLCYANLSKAREAAESLAAALKVFPDYHDARVDLGFIFFMAGQPERAQNCAHYVIEKSPQHPRVGELMKALGG